MKTTTKIYERKDGCLICEMRFTAEYKPPTYGDDHEEMLARYEMDETQTPTIGTQYKIARISYTGPDQTKHGDEHIKYTRRTNAGWPGNSDPGIKKFHGWRGTSDDWAFFGLGVRKCLDVIHTGNRSYKIRIVFGPDLIPDEE